LRKLRLRQPVARVRLRRRRRIQRQQRSNLLPQISRQDSSRHRQVNPEQQDSLAYQGKLQPWGNLECLAQ
jgi:hypothetical protein